MITLVGERASYLVDRNEYSPEAGDTMKARTVGILLGFGFLVQGVGALEIDSFNYTTSASDSAVFDDPSILGGEVDFTYGNGTQTLDGAVEVAGGVFTFGPATSTGLSDFGSLEVIYDGNDGDPGINNTGLDPLDLRGTLGVTIDIVEVTGSVPLNISVWTNSGSIFTYSQTLSDLTGTLFIPWEDFDEVGTPSLSEVRGFTLRMLFEIGEGISFDNFAVREAADDAPTPPGGGPAVEIDVTRPELSVRGGKTIEVRRERVVVRGRATGDSGVARVEVRARKGRFKAAKLKVNGNWSTVVRVAEATREVLKIRAIDRVGNSSEVVRVRVVRR